MNTATLARGGVRVWRRLRAMARMLRAASHLAVGMAVVAARFARMDDAGRQAHVQTWSAGLLAALGVGLSVRGSARPGATLVVANHVSWLDVAAMHAVMPQARFVSKAAVAHWPLVGAMVRAAGTLFIERERKRDALRVVHQMAGALQAGHTVAVFPEGTTGPGTPLLPFHANLLQAAIATETPVQPVVLRWADARERFSGAAEYVGDTTLLASAWRLACAQGLCVHLEILPPQATRHADRRALAASLRALIQARLEAG